MTLIGLGEWLDWRTQCVVAWFGGMLWSLEDLVSAHASPDDMRVAWRLGNVYAKSSASIRHVPA
jgi:hypothetical protein